MKYLLIFMLLLYSAINSNSMIITVSMTWNRDLSRYNLQDGSIVQVIAYNSNNASSPGNTTESNFDMADNNLYYNPYTTPLNHDILLQTQVIEGGNGGSVFETFDLLDNFNRVYIRIFSTTNFEQEEITLSYWGLSSVRNINNNSVYFNWNNIGANNGPVYFTDSYFEVIPEPSTLALIVLTCILLFIKKIYKYLYEY